MDGTGLNQNFITSGTLGDDFGIAADVADGLLFWGEFGGSTTDTIGSAKIDGTSVNNAFVTNVTKPSGVAVDSSAGQIYWSFVTMVGTASITRLQC